MKILKLKIHWMKVWSSDPMIQVLVDRETKLDELRFDARDDLYFAELDGYVAFFAHCPGNQRGSGGSVFDLTMRDGSKVSLKGPWSSRPAVANQLGFTESIDVSLTDDPAAFERGYTFMAAHATVEAVRAALPAELELIRVDKHGEFKYVVTRRGMTVEQSKELAVS